MASLIGSLKEPLLTLGDFEARGIRAVTPPEPISH